MRSSWRSSTFISLSWAPPRPGSIPSRLVERPHPPHCPQLVEEVVEAELVAAQLALQLDRVVLVELALGLLDQAQHVAHAEDPLGHAVGVEALELLEVLAGGGEQDRLACDRLDGERGAAAGVAVELAHHHPVEVRRRRRTARRR